MSFSCLNPSAEWDILTRQNYINNEEIVMSDPILDTYTKKSEDPEYCGYNQLQCAAFGEDVAAVTHLLELYRSDGTLEGQLQFQNTTAPGEAKPTFENILHVAMKNPVVFKLICNELLNSPDIFVSLIKQTDMDGDNVLHQFLQFERSESCAILADLVKGVEDKNDRAQLVEALQEAMEATNQAGESPASRMESHASDPKKHVVIESMQALQTVLLEVSAGLSR